MTTLPERLLAAAEACEPSAKPLRALLREAATALQPSGGGVVDLNDEVLVKLNAHGLAILKADHDAFRAQVPSIAEWMPPKVDADGYSRRQLWCLFQDFGPHISLPVKKPFDAMKLPAIASPAQADGFVLGEDDVEWVVNDLAELGVRIRGQCFFLYKGNSLVYETAKHDDGTPMFVRTVGKREFGECCHPINYSDPSCIGTVNLSDSDRWEPLTAAPSAPRGLGG